MKRTIDKIYSAGSVAMLVPVLLFSFTPQKEQRFNIADYVQLETNGEKAEEPTTENKVGDLINLGEYEITAYCACEKCCGKSDGITATGTVATARRTIAVDPNTIPYGTEVIIDGHTYVAEDCGGAIKGNHIDIYFDNHEDALEFGKQYKNVYVIRGEENGTGKTF